jgi:hypothetical protein
MGDQNAVDIAQALRTDALVNHDVCGDDDFMEYGKQIPRGGLLVGVYIDDLCVELTTRNADLGAAASSDHVAVRKCHDCYDSIGFKRAKEGLRLGSRQARR